MAAEVSRQTGKDIPYHNLPEEEYAEILKGVGLPDGLAKAIAGFDIGASKNDLYDSGKQLSALIGHSTMPLSDLVKKALS